MRAQSAPTVLEKTSNATVHTPVGSFLQVLFAAVGIESPAM
jgi:hypothetical protein